MIQQRFAEFLNNKHNILVQFIKYAMAGVVGAATFVVIFTALNETVLPADASLAGATRGWNFFFSNSIAFVLSSFVSYLANRTWVFQSGRHTRGREFALFVGIGAIAFVISTPLGSWIVAHYPVSEYIIFVLLVVSSAMINFLGRKYIVFLH